MNDKTLETLLKLKKIGSAAQHASESIQHLAQSWDELDESYNIELAGIVYTKHGQVWDPMDHPRNQAGHFVKKGFGIFLFGKTKTAKYTIPGQVEIDYDLEPGDIAIKSPAGNLYIKHPDGSWTAKTVNTGPTIKVNETEYDAGSIQVKYLDQHFEVTKDYKKIDEAPAVEVPADDEQQAQSGLSKMEIGKPVNKAQMAILPMGSVVMPPTGQGAHLVKNSEGHWINQVSGADNGVWKYGQMTLLEIGAVSKPSPEVKPGSATSKDEVLEDWEKELLKPVDPVTEKDIDEIEELLKPVSQMEKKVPTVGQKWKGTDFTTQDAADLPDGTVLTVGDDEGFTPVLKDYHKVDGKWRMMTKAGVLSQNANTDENFADFLNDPYFSVTVKSLGGEEKPKPGQAKESDVPVAKPVPVPVEGKKNKLTAANPLDAPDPNGSITPVDGKGLLSVITNDGFKHPISGTAFPLEEGDQVLQHKITPESFAVLSKDGEKKYQVNKLGKKYKWSPHIPKSNYKVIHTAAKNSDNFDSQAEGLPDVSQFLKGNKFTHPESNITVEIGDDEVLMEHNFTPLSYLVMGKDGSMKYKIDVKGKKQKAGTNLKPSNYHSVEVKKAKPIDWGVPANEVPLFSAGEKKAILAAADPGDFLDFKKHGANFHLVKLDNDTWKDEDGTSWDMSSLLTMMPEETDAMSVDGIPLGKQKFSGHLLAMPEGGKIKTENFSVYKTSEGLYETEYLSEGDLTKSTKSTFGSVLTVGAVFKGTVSAEQKKALTYHEPKPKKNTNGLPYDPDELADYLDKQPVGTELQSNGVTLQTKTGTGQWTNNVGDTKDDTVLGTALAKVMKDAYSIKLPPPPKKETTNQHGVPLDITKEWLDNLPIGTKFGVDNSPGNVATKIDSGHWQGTSAGSGSQVKVTTNNLLVGIKKWSPDKKAQAQILSSPGPVGNVAKKATAAKKPKAAPTAVGAPTVTFNDASEVEQYIAPSDYSGTATGIFKALTEAPEDAAGIDHKHLSTYYQSSLLPSPWQISEGEPIDYIGSEEMLKAINDGLANIAYAKSQKSLGLPTSLKTKLTKLQGKLEHLKKISETVQALNAGEVPEMPGSFKWGNKKTFEFDMADVESALLKKHSQAKFTKTLAEEIDFDPFNATTEQYEEYLQGKGETWSIYLTPEYKKKLALHLMGAPGSYQLTTYSIENLKGYAAKGQFAGTVSEAVKAQNGQPFQVKTAPGHPFPPKPDHLGFNSDQWNQLAYLLSDKFDVSTIPNPDTNMKDIGYIGDYIPPDAAKVLNHASTVGVTVGQSSKAQLASYLLLSGIWFDNSLTYEHPKGKIALTPGMTVYEDPIGRLWFVPKDYEFSSAGGKVTFLDNDNQFETTAFLNASSINGWTKLYEAPFTLKLGDALKEGLQVSTTEWDRVEALEGHVKPKETFTGTELVTLKKILANHPIKPSELSNKAKSVILTDPSTAELVVFKDLKGHYRADEQSAPPSTFQDFVKTLGKGGVGGTAMTKLAKVNPESFTGFVSLQFTEFEAEDAYAAITGNSMDPSMDLAGKRYTLWEAVTNFDTSQAFQAAAVPPPVGVKGTLFKLPNQNLGGGRPKKYFADADGEKYLTKPDPVKKFRPDTEHAANEIARMFGYQVPATDVREIDGEYSYVQHLAPASGSLEGVPVSDLTEQQLIDAMSGHVLDWAISNHDAHEGNMLFDPDGGILKIDLGQAYKALGSDKLAVGYKMPGNFGDIWYDRFYKQVQGKKLSKETVDAVAAAVLKKARRISTSNEEPYRTQLEFAFQNRMAFPKIGSKQHTRESYIELALERKSSTFDDFFGLYKDLYAKGGYDFPFTKEQFETSTLGDSDVHLKVSDDLLAQVLDNGSYGKSLMVDSKEIEDSHILLYSTKAKNGTNNLKGDLKVRKDGDAKIVAWLKQQGIDTTMVSTSPTATATSGLPDTTGAWPNLVALAKTVSTHSGDGQYNQDTVKKAKDTQANLKGQVDLIEGAIKKDPTFVSTGAGVLPKFQSGHQQQAWLAWAKDILPKFDATLDAMSKGEKSPKWSQIEPVYTPPKDIDITGKPTPIEELSGDGKKYTKYSDWNYLGPSGPITQHEYEQLQKKSGWTTKSLKSPGPTSKQVATKPVYKIKKVKFSTSTVSNKDETGKVTESGQQTGHNFKSEAYEITSENAPGVTLQYLPHHMAVDDKTNLGRLQFKVENFDGSQDQAEQALNMIRDMGVDFAEADEESLELFYWRHLYGELKDRKSTHKGNYQITLDSINKGYAQGALNKAEELDLLKSSFVASMGADTVKKADWRPKFDSGRFGLPGYEEGTTDGRPYWMRPDFDIVKYKKWSNGRLPGRDFWNSEGDSFSSAIRPFDNSGGFLSGEERVRFTGSFASGSGSSGSSTSSQDRVVGGSQVIFTRAKHELGMNKQYFEPTVTGRTHTWHAQSDAYGATAKKQSQSPFNLQELIENSSTEMNIKYGTSAWDGLAATMVDASTRKKMLEYFAKKGITEIRGIPLAERIVDNTTDLKKVLEKVWDAAIKQQKETQAAWEKERGL